MKHLKDFLAALGLTIVLFAFVAIIYCALTEDPKTVPPQQPAANFKLSQMTGNDLYLDLLKRTLTRYLNPETHQEVPYGLVHRPLYRPLYYAKRFLNYLDMDIIKRRAFEPEEVAEGRSNTRDLDTLIGLKRLDNLQYCIKDVLDKKIPGDLIECGAWRGGATIFMRAVLHVYGDSERKVWVSDSFEGMPPTDTQNYPEDANYQWVEGADAVSLETVKVNFARYGLLDDRVVFLKGFFKDTLPSAPLSTLAILRVDADMYQSTFEALTYVYPKLSPGGYCILDDYYTIPVCRKAIDDYRQKNGVTETIQKIDENGIFWQKRFHTAPGSTSPSDRRQ